MADWGYSDNPRPQIRDIARHHQEPHCGLVYTTLTPNHQPHDQIQVVRYTLPPFSDENSFFILPDDGFLSPSGVCLPCIYPILHRPRPLFLHLHGTHIVRPFCTRTHPRLTFARRRSPERVVLAKKGTMDRHPIHAGTSESVVTSRLKRMLAHFEA